MAYVPNAVYDTKMQTWYGTKMKMKHAYVHQPSQPKLKKEKQLQALLANKQM
jgi:23S rRNA maturation mini-RNase III